MCDFTGMADPIQTYELTKCLPKWYFMFENSEFNNAVTISGLILGCFSLLHAIK